MKKFMGMIWPTDTTPRGALRLFEVGHGYRTCPKMCMADSLILPMAPTRGELLVVFTSVMAATCVWRGALGRVRDGGDDSRRRPAWREKCEDSAIQAAGRRATGARWVTAPRPRRAERPRAWLITPASSRRSRQSTRHGAHWRRFTRGGTAGLDTSHEPTVPETHAPSGSRVRGARYDARSCA